MPRDAAPREAAPRDAAPRDSSPILNFPFPNFRLPMLNALRYYWIISKGYRLRPWSSPYIQWRLETFFGHEAADLTPSKFFALMWRERTRMERFLEWVASRRHAQHW